MCIEIWNTFRGCSHRVYQNTSPCHVARRCDPKDDMLLDKTKFLPDKQFKLPPGMLECKHRLALRPKDTSCPECAREQRRTAAAAAANGNGATATRAGGTPSSSSDEQRLESSPSPPDGKAAERVRHSLMLLEQFRKKPF